MPSHLKRTHRPVPFVDLKRQHRVLNTSLRRVFQGAIHTSQFILGDEVERFEHAFARLTGSRYAVSVASGTDALHLSLRAAGIGPGDEVLVPAMTFAATALAVLYTGAKPIPVDVQENNALIDLKDAQRALTTRTRAIIPVHLFGQPCDMTPLMAFAKAHRLSTIEDACQAHGARYRNRSVGSFGMTGCFSFYPTKNLGALGDGGIIVTDEDSVFKKLRMLRNYGQPRKYIHQSLGFNSRLDTLQAAILNLKLRSLESGNTARRHHADRYRSLLRDLPIQTMESSLESVPVYHLFVVRTTFRDDLAKFLHSRGIATGIHYPIPIHRTGFMKLLGSQRRCPAAERLSQTVLSLPMFPELRSHEVDRVTHAIQAFFQSRS